MKSLEYRFIKSGWGLAKHRKDYALIFGDDEYFAYVAVGFTRYQAKKEIKRILSSTPK